MISAGVIGATGYAGVELVRLLLCHPEVGNVFVSSVSFEGQQLDAVYPNLYSLCGSAPLYGKSTGLLETADAVVEKSDVIFTALPHGVAEQYADRCVKTGKKLIDLSADFRFDKDEAVFAKWYKKNWDYPEVHAESVYGLPEMNRRRIASARIIGNPGCYVTSATLALLPALSENMIETDTIIIDSKSGVTGAGRNPTMTNQFCECGESMSAYGVGAHRHQPEIAHNCKAISGKPCGIVFTPHLVPMSRGIISTIYAFLKNPPDLPDDAACKAFTAEIRNRYQAFYVAEPFVRVLPEGKNPVTKNVRYSNYCDMQVYTVHNGRMLQIVSVLDNMVKGAAGQAVQNMNLMFGFAETAGLDMIPPAF